MKEYCDVQTVATEVSVDVTTNTVENIYENEKLSFRTLEKQDNCSSGCLTDSTGPVKNSCCVFPFIYKDKKHNTCVEVKGAKAWCSTSVDSNQEYLHNMWGYCNPTCTFQAPSPYLERRY